ncbi:MAG TPA: hypothetical protein VGI77_03560 [Gaiellaceae bacterium]|jgi:hypothetical protein
MIRVVAAAAAIAGALVLAGIAIDAGRWTHATTSPPRTLVGGVAENLLGTSDDLALRRAIRTFEVAERTPYGLDNGATQARTRALAQGVLADVASGADAKQASQADDLLGVLAWGGTQAPVGAVDPADRAVGAFTDAVRLDPTNVDAAFNLELALRALQSRGVRSGPSPSSGPRGTGHSGAGAGTPGRGY